MSDDARILSADAACTDREFHAFDAPFHEVAEAFRSFPWRSGHISPKAAALICLATNATTTQMHAEGTRRYIRLALELGASVGEIVETLQLTSTIGIHACALGIPLLLAEIDPTGETRHAEIAQDERRSALKQDFIAKRGYWDEVWDGLLWLDPDYLQSFLIFSAAPWLTGSLEPKLKEFIYIAVDITTTHLFALGARIHIRNALRLGATPEEITAVTQLASAVGLNACTLGGSILAAELAAARKNGD